MKCFFYLQIAFAEHIPGTLQSASDDALARHYGQGARRRFYFQRSAFIIDESVFVQPETLLELLLMYAGEIDVVILNNP